jgi:hypothetical protein
LEQPLSERLMFQRSPSGKAKLFIDLSGLQIISTGQVSELEETVRALLACELKSDEKAHAFVNYDNFGVLPNLADEYADMVVRVGHDCYSDVTRFGSRSFARARL